MCNPSAETLTPESIISLRQVSVRYRLPKERINSLKEFVVKMIRRRVEYEEFWALREVSWEVAPRAMVGIIGRNGAGKSTLLKVVARVMKPQTGSVSVTGRIAPLIELGTGFDPELTGLENVYLYGSILGLGWKEMHRRLDGIIAFAELADFIQSPLRTYSSGMIARLGFAIATTLEADILILDEILSVGDVAFQGKCQETIAQFRKKGVTILFVSHDLPQVRKLCDRTLWLDHGRVMAWGETNRVVEAYEQFLARNHQDPARALTSLT